MDVMTEKEAKEIMDKFQEYENKFGEEGKLVGNTRFRVHILADWAHKLVNHPSILSVVRQILGDDILVWDSDFNIKEPGTKGHYTWHQDGIYAGIQNSDHIVTAWFALTNSTDESGCMHFLPSSHHHQLKHRVETDIDMDNQLSLGQEVKDMSFVQEKLGEVVHAELRAGQVSFHHWNLVHASFQNKSNYRRIGLAIRYMSGKAAMQDDCEKEFATLVSGSTGDNFLLEKAPEEDYSDEAWRRWEESNARQKQNYFARHDLTNRGFK